MDGRTEPAAHLQRCPAQYKPGKPASIINEQHDRPTHLRSINPRLPNVGALRRGTRIEGKAPSLPKLNDPFFFLSFFLSPYLNPTPTRGKRFIDFTTKDCFSIKLKERNVIYLEHSE